LHVPLSVGNCDHHDIGIVDVLVDFELEHISLYNAIKLTKIIPSFSEHKTSRLFRINVYPHCNNVVQWATEFDDGMA
jgi:hypothetical protein